MSEYYQAIIPELSQFDIVETATHLKLNEPVVFLSNDEGESVLVGPSPTDRVIATAEHKLALVISPDCDLDKPRTKHCLICPIYPLSVVSGADAGTIKKNKALRFLFLPSKAPSIPESFVDLAAISTVSIDLMRNATRLATLSDMARKAFYMQQIRWISRWTLSNVACPQCGLNFNPADTLPVRSV